eukprot:13283174-Heterocapsa_arctica.AAC.1
MAGGGNRRPDFQGAAQGIDKGTSFRLPRKSWSGKIKGAFSRFVSILSSETWPAARKAKLSGGGTKAGECPFCRAEGCSVQEIAVHRWWFCPRW